MAYLVTMLNQKGGVGKTTISCHLAFAALEAGKSVLMVDLDTQGNASQFMSQDMDVHLSSGGAEQLYEDGELKYLDTPHANLKLLHGHKDLEALDQDVERIFGIAPSLAAKMRALPFDNVIFDTPTSIGPRSVTPLFWSDLAVIAVRPSLSSMVGLKETIETIGNVRRVNRRLKAKYVINQMNKSSSSQKEARNALVEKFGPDVLAEFSTRQHVADALDSFVPVWSYTRDAKLKKEWRAFTATTLNLTA
jgi:chromosome partitioning protein